MVDIIEMEEPKITPEYWRGFLNLGIERSLNLSGVDREDYATALEIYSASSMYQIVFYPKWKDGEITRPAMNAAITLMREAVDSFTRVEQQGNLTQEDRISVSAMIPDMEKRLKFFNRMSYLGLSPDSATREKLLKEFETKQPESRIKDWAERVKRGEGLSLLRD